ncbi:glycosyltransferase [Rhodanobacter lindaniclasticus]
MLRTKFPRRLLIILPDLGDGGAQLMNLRLASLLTDRGWLVTVVLLFKRQRCRRFSSNFPRLRIIAMDADRLHKRLLLPFRLARIARREDIVLAGLELAATTYGFIAARIAGKPFIGWVHTTFHLHVRTTSKFNQWLSLCTHRHTRYQVFPSVGAMASMSRALREHTAHLGWRVIDNFNHCFGEQDEAETVPCTAAFSRPVIISMGRLSVEKGWQRLLRAHAKLRQGGT